MKPLVRMKMLSIMLPRMATEKAIAVAQKASPNAIILAADTTVANGDIILGKPQTEAEAITMLTNLRNKTHRVYTAMSIAHKDKIKTICVGSDVPIAKLYGSRNAILYRIRGPI